MTEQLINPTFSYLFENNPVGEAIKQEIQDKILIATMGKEEQITELKAETEKQKALSSQMLLELAKLKQGGN